MPLNIGAAEVLVLILVWVLPALLIARYAAGRGMSFSLVLLGGLLVSALLTLVVVLVIARSQSARTSSANLGRVHPRRSRVVARLSKAGRAGSEHVAV